MILTVNRLNSKQVKQNWNTFKLFDFPKSRLKQATFLSDDDFHYSRPLKWLLPRYCYRWVIVRQPYLNLYISLPFFWPDKFINSWLFSWKALSSNKGQYLSSLGYPKKCFTSTSSNYYYNNVSLFSSNNKISLVIYCMKSISNWLTVMTT